MLAISRRVGPIIRAVRSYYAVVPLAVPFVLASFSHNPTVEIAVPKAPPAPLLRFDLSSSPVPALPPHASYLTIDPGDTLDRIFSLGGVEQKNLTYLTQAFAKVVDPRKLRPGDVVRFQYDETHEIETIEMKITGWGAVRAQRGTAGYDVVAHQSPQRVEHRTIRATINDSLYGALVASGENAQLATAIVDVFQWDIDFFRLKEGDEFSLVVEKKYAGDDFIGYGPVLAARFIHRGDPYEAFRFEGANGAGYYNRDGRPLRKQFLKSPLKFTRITSGFTHRRFHPVLGIWRPHPGVDYGAPVGTPVMATADGVVTFAGRGRGEGNYIKLRHNASMETAYLHLSKFAKGIERGAKVRQGDVIGYVGSTGLSTGPHLDYRVAERGTWINPLTLKSITADPLGGESLRQFRASVAKLLPEVENSALQIAAR